MDTHVLHIFLLLAITLVCIGVSVSVKYDKSQITTDTHPDMSHAHVPDVNYENLSTESQKQINTLNSQVLLNENDINDLANFERNANNVIPSLDSSNLPTVLTPGIMDLDDFANLFPSESWLTAVGYVGYDTINATPNLQTNNTQGYSFTLTYNDDTHQITISNGHLFGSLANGSQLVSSFYLSSDGFLMSNSFPSIYYTTSDAFHQFVQQVGPSIKQIVQNNRSVYIFRLEGSKIRVYQGVSSPPLTTCLYRLEYFGLSNDNNLPSGNDINWVSSGVTFNTIPQTAFTNTSGLFARVGGTGFTSTISSDHYSISVLNSNILNSGNIPDAYTLSVPSNKPFYNIPTNGHPFYSIHLVLLTDVSTSSGFTLKDTNDTPGVQNVVIFCIPNNNSPKYTQIARGTESVRVLQTINSAFLSKQLYNLYPNYVPVNFIFFPFYYENQENKQFSLDINTTLGKVRHDRTTGNFCLNGGISEMNQYSYTYDDDDGIYVEVEA